MTYDFIGFEQGLTVLAGVESVYVLEVRRGGELVDFGDVQFGGVVRDADGEGVGAMVCVVEGVGRVRVVVPGLAVGEYVYEVEYVCSDGGGYRLLWGRIGVLGTGLSLGGEVVGGGERVLSLQLPGVVGGEVVGRWLASSVAECAAGRAVAAAERAAGLLGVAQEVAGLLGERLAEVVVPDEGTGTWHVGGVDTGCVWRGEDGEDGRSIRRYVVDDVGELPEGGELCHGGVYWYVTGRMGVYDLGVGEGVYLYVEVAENHPDGCGLRVGGVDVYVGGGVGLDVWVDVLNRDFGGVVRATRADERRVLLQNVGGEVLRVEAESTGVTDMYLSRWYGYRVYAWLEYGGEGRWEDVGEAEDMADMPVATETGVGGVKLCRTLGQLPSGDHVLPTAAAVVSFVLQQTGQVKGALGQSLTTVGMKADAAVESAQAALDRAEEVGAAVEELKAGVPVFVEVSVAEYEAMEEAGEVQEGVYYLLYEEV